MRILTKSIGGWETDAWLVDLEMVIRPLLKEYDEHDSGIMEISRIEQPYVRYVVVSKTTLTGFGIDETMAFPAYASGKYRGIGHGKQQLAGGQGYNHYDALDELAKNYVGLECDIEANGRRGSRTDSRFPRCNPTMSQITRSHIPHRLRNATEELNRQGTEGQGSNSQAVFDAEYYVIDGYYPGDVCHYVGVDLDDPTFLSSMTGSVQYALAHEGLLYNTVQRDRFDGYQEHTEPIEHDWIFHVVDLTWLPEEWI